MLRNRAKRKYGTVAQSYGSSDFTGQQYFFFVKLPRLAASFLFYVLIWGALRTDYKKHPPSSICFPRENLWMMADVLFPKVIGWGSGLRKASFPGPECRLRGGLPNGWCRCGNDRRWQILLREFQPRGCRIQRLRQRS